MAEKADKYAKLAFVLMASDSMSNVLKEAAANADKSFTAIEKAAISAACLTCHSQATVEERFSTSFLNY
jgi:cytochrome c553